MTTCEKRGVDFALAHGAPGKREDQAGSFSARPADLLEILDKSRDQG